ncbi:hypothetical protein C8R46DRAFT_1047391 [Mycena filopes]|nr:hypothetical protein C8R46DRAFT_1047391 [Mycena filopes]
MSEIPFNTPSGVAWNTCVSTELENELERRNAPTVSENGGRSKGFLVRGIRERQWLQSKVLPSESLTSNVGPGSGGMRDPISLGGKLDHIQPFCFRRPSSDSRFKAWPCAALVAGVSLGAMPSAVARKLAFLRDFLRDFSLTNALKTPHPHEVFLSFSDLGLSAWLLPHFRSNTEFIRRKTAASASRMQNAGPVISRLLEFSSRVQHADFCKKNQRKTVCGIDILRLIF